MYCNMAVSAIVFVIMLIGMRYRVRNKKRQLDKTRMNIRGLQVFALTLILIGSVPLLFVRNEPGNSFDSIIVIIGILGILFSQIVDSFDRRLAVLESANERKTCELE